jgi:hypothetical protein
VPEVIASPTTCEEGLPLGRPLLEPSSDLRLAPFSRMQLWQGAFAPEGNLRLQVAEECSFREKWVARLG